MLLLLMRTIRVLRFRCCMCFCMLRCSMLLPAAERRPTVTPISYLEGRKCSFPLTLSLLLCWCHNQSCLAPRDMSIQTLSSVYFSRSLQAHYIPLESVTAVNDDPRWGGPPVATQSAPPPSPRARRATASAHSPARDFPPRLRPAPSGPHGPLRPDPPSRGRWGRFARVAPRHDRRLRARRVCSAHARDDATPSRPRLMRGTPAQPAQSPAVTNLQGQGKAFLLHPTRRTYI